MKILLVEDEARLATAVRRVLDDEGYATDWAADGADGLNRAENGEYDVILLDVMLPSYDGYEIARRLRSDGSTVPILMLTARDGIQDRVRGLDAGADDYLVKPFALDELLARLRALLRRTNMSGNDEVLRVGDLSLDPARRQVWRGDRELELTKTEFDLLELLLYNAGIVLTREQIYERIWGFDFETSSRSLDVYVGYLRAKTEVEGAPRIIHTVRGVGYVARADTR